MKNLELEHYGVQSLSFDEQQETEGGILLGGYWSLGAGLVMACVDIYNGWQTAHKEANNNW